MSAKHVFFTVRTGYVSFRASTGETGSNPSNSDAVLALMMQDFERRGYSTEVRDEREEPNNGDFTPQMAAMLDLPVCAGNPTTLRQVFKTIAAIGDGGAGHPKNVQNMTGLPSERCEEIAKTVNLMLSLPSPL